LYAYIADQSSEARAGSYIARITDCCQSLAHFPERGTRRDDVRRGLRTIGFERHVTVAFSVHREAKQVRVLGIYYGGQDFEAALREED
jgi:toxin ParE1/3/4